jgi:hypothetical protein
MIGIFRVIQPFFLFAFADRYSRHRRRQANRGLAFGTVTFVAVMCAHVVVNKQTEVSDAA